MSLHFIEYDGGMHHVYVHDGRGHRTRIGPRIGWEKPRDAIDYANSLDRESPSPLRSTGEPAPASGILPPVEEVVVGSPVEPRGRRRRLKGRR